jgi:Asp-tRNA(Asn)/Glu-tRNA(Gln) amidotransferase B subunit
MNQWEVVIGMETHAQLATVSKIFSGAATAFGAEPNTQACAIDLAFPGVLPVLNRQAVECAIRFGLALGGSRWLRNRFLHARTTFTLTCPKATRSVSSICPWYRAAR